MAWRWPSNANSTLLIADHRAQLSPLPIRHDHVGATVRSDLARVQTDPVVENRADRTAVADGENGCLRVVRGHVVEGGGGTPFQLNLGFAAVRSVLAGMAQSVSPCRTR